MGERAKSEESTELREKSKPITDVTRWMLMGEIRTAVHDDPETVLYPDGYEITFGKRDADITVRLEGFEQALYHLYLDDPGNGVEFEVSEGSEPARRLPLNETGGIWLRELIAEGLKKRDES